MQLIKSKDWAVFRHANKILSSDLRDIKEEFEKSDKTCLVKIIKYVQCYTMAVYDNTLKKLDTFKIYTRRELEYEIESRNAFVIERVSRYDKEEPARQADIDMRQPSRMVMNDIEYTYVPPTPAIAYVNDRNKERRLVQACQEGSVPLTLKPLQAVTKEVLIDAFSKADDFTKLIACKKGFHSYQELSMNELIDLLLDTSVHSLELRDFVMNDHLASASFVPDQLTFLNGRYRRKVEHRWTKED